MAINNVGMNNIGGYYNNNVNRSDRTENVKSVSAEAAVSIESLSDVDRTKGIGFLNNSSDSISSMTEKKYPNDLSNIFKMDVSNLLISRATAPRVNDNEDAAKIKKEYKDLANEINKDLAHAKSLVAKMGEGQHELTDKNGKKVADVNITKDKEGNITVDISNVDGSKTKVTYNEKKPGDCRIDKVDKEGNKVSMGKGDTKCDKTENGVTDSYSVGKDGGVVKETEGPGEDDFKKVVVNKDGSTDNYDMVYKDDKGEPIFEHTSKPPKNGTNPTKPGDDEDVLKEVDLSTLKAINDLNKENPKGKINAEQMEKLIISATEDADGQAAGKEYNQLKTFVTQNWNRLDDTAKAVWNVYENCARTCIANGQEGIPQEMYDKMKTDMAAIKNKEGKEGKEAPKSGETAPKVVEEAPKVGDGTQVGEGGEEEDDIDIINPIVKEPEDENVGEGSEDKIGEAENVAGKTKYKDAGAGKAIDALNKTNPKGEISAEQIEKLILDATGDADGQAAGKEYQDLVAFIEKNWNRLNDDAKAVWNVYENYARSAIDEGRSGIYEDDYKKMIAEMQEIRAKKAEEPEEAEKQM